MKCDAGEQQAHCDRGTTGGRRHGTRVSKRLSNGSGFLDSEISNGNRAWNVGAATTLMVAV
jgi:hypothetical protein